MKPQTVNELIKVLQTLSASGYGEHIVLVSDDEECNGFHELYGSNEGAGDNLTFYNEISRSRETRPTIQIA